MKKEQLGLRSSKMQNQVFKLSQCRICKNDKLTKVISLGKTPPANAFLKKSELGLPEPFFPLHVNFCPICRQLQLSHIVSPELLFRNYVYVSSTSPVFVSHFEEYAKDVFKSLKLKKVDLVLDIGSNDGILLKPFRKLGARVLGVDPARKIAREASKNGIQTIPDFFDQKVAKKIVKKYGLVKLICANNVFAHINNLDEIIAAVLSLLSKDGVFIIEAPYLVVFLQKNLFDTIYHEHLSYFSVKPLVALFKRHNMKVFDVWETSSHGGSIRVFVSREKSKYKVKKSVPKLLKKEELLGLDNLQTYLKFAKKIKQNRVKLIALLKKLKTQGKRIVGFGAPAKGNTLLNYFKIGPEVLDYIVDDSKYKQNLFTPGTHIPVLSPTRILKDKPDYVFILAWNFAGPIMDKLSDYKKVGGHFIIPVPEPAIL